MVKAACLCVVILLPHAALAQSAPPVAPTTPAPATTWVASASAMAYWIPDDDDYVSPTAIADHGRLHLEARYNYEGRSTGSAWLGYNMGVGDNVRLDFTPMLGGVFGDTTGIAPGFRGSLAWRKLELYSENEFVFDLNDHADNFFYTWSELSFSPKDWFRVGAVAQRTRAYETPLDVQRGVLIGASLRRVDLTAYMFNWGWTDPTYVFAITVR